MRIHAAAILYFDAVRRAGSIREAARRLNVASSAVNRQILKLEEEVGASLFERLPAGLKLTAAGEALARHVIAVLQDLDRARSDIESLRGGRAGHIRVIAVEGVCGEILPDAIGRLQERAPRVTVTVETSGSFSIPRAIAEGEVDLGIAFALGRDAGLQQVAIGRFRLGAVMAPDHPLASRKTVPLSACMAHPLILPSPELSIHRFLEPFMARVPLRPHPVVTSSSVELMRELAARGRGIAFQTRIGLSRAIADGALVHVPLDAGGPIWSDLGVYLRAGRSPPVALDSFVRLLAEEFARREAEEEAALA